MQIATTTTTKKKIKPYVRLGDAPRGFTRRPDGDIMDAHRQFTTRPADERVMTPDEYLARTREIRARSKEYNVNLRDLKVSVTPDGLPALGRGGMPLALTNYSLGAVCALAQRDDGEGGKTTPPASYLSTLPGERLADLLTFELGRASDKAIQILAAGTPQGPILRAITSQRYERLWDAELAERIHALCARSTWGAARSFTRAGGVKPSHAWGEVEPLPLGWVGDRSSFVVLVDHETPISLNGNLYQRFLMLSNSEVGNASFKVTFGLVDFICCNMIFWGCHEVHEACFRHVGEDFRSNVAATFAAVANVPALDSGRLERDAYKASKHMLADTRGDAIGVAVRKTGLPVVVVEEGFERAAASERYGDPLSVWGLVNGITEASQHRTGFASERAETDAKAAKLFDFVF